MPDPTRLIPPIRGVGNNRPYIDTPGDLSPPESTRNFRTHDVAKDRPCGGKRAGLRKAFTQRMGDGTHGVVAACAITRATAVSGYTIGQTTPLGAYESRVSSALHGNAFMLDSSLGMFRDFIEERPTAGTRPVVAVTWIGTDRMAWIANYTLAGNAVCAVRVVRTDGSVVWSAICQDADPGSALPASPASISGNTLCYIVPVGYGPGLVLVAAGPYVYVFSADSGRYIQRFNCAGQSSEVVDVKPLPDQSGVYVLFYGSNVGATLPGGVTVTAGKYAAHFRAGVMRALVDVFINVGTLAQDTAAYGANLSAGAPFFESAHNYARLSELLVRAPRGGYPTALRVFSDRGVAVSFTNQGWGPNATYAPDGSAPYSTVARLDPTGHVLWEVDTQSLLVAGDGGYTNDITAGGGGDNASIQALCTDAAGNTYAAGRENNATAGACVFALDPLGSILWTKGIQTYSDPAVLTVRQGGAATDPTDNNPVFVGDRNNTSGSNAMLWKLSAETGAVAATYDLGGAFSGLGLDINSAGQYALGSDRV